MNGATIVLIFLTSVLIYQDFKRDTAVKKARVKSSTRLRAVPYRKRNRGVYSIVVVWTISVTLILLLFSIMVLGVLDKAR